MALPLESVPNFSEGRDRSTIDALATALSAHAVLLDVHSDPDHNRSVFTIVGDERELTEALLAAIDCARARIDLRRHEGVHPRIGAADVVPIVPVRPEEMARARRAALLLAKRIAVEFPLPVFLYGEVGQGRTPAFFRRGGPEELQRRLDAGEVQADYGPPLLDERAGGVLVGARRALIAFNVTLRGLSVTDAGEIAVAIRETGGGFHGVRALALELPRAGVVQISMNVEDWQSAPLHEVVERIAGAAAARGAEILAGELVGLMPAGAAALAAGSVVRVEDLDASRLLEARLLELRAEDA